MKNDAAETPKVCIKPIVLVLLPGIDGTGLLFRNLTASLPSSISSVVVRFPGTKNLTYEELKVLVLNAIPQTQRFILLAESFSGPLAVTIASERPKGLIGLILCATFVMPPWRMITPIIPLIARSSLFHLYLPYKRLKARLSGYDNVEYRALLAEMNDLIRPAVIAARVRMVFKVDVQHAMRLCDIPTLYIQGARDRVVPSRNLHVIQLLKPDIRIAVVGTSHMVLQRQPEQAAKVISDFARSLSMQYQT